MRHVCVGVSPAPLQDVERGEIIGQNEAGVPVRHSGGIQEEQDFGRHFALVQEDHRGHHGLGPCILNPHEEIHGNS